MARIVDDTVLARDGQPDARVFRPVGPGRVQRVLRASGLGLMLVAGLSALAPRAGAQGEAPPGPPQTVIETGDEAPTDDRINQRIAQIFAELDGLEGVTTAVRAGVVVLRGEVAERTLAVRAEELAARVDGVVAVRNEITEIVDVRERIVPVMERFGDRLLAFVYYLPLLSVAALALAAIAFAGWWLARRTWPWSQITPNAFIADLVRQVVRLSFLALGLVVFLDILGATGALGTIAGAAGIFGLAVGFAVRDTVENYIASMLLSIRQPFRPGDHVLIEGHEGFVVRLSSRATILLSLEGNHIRIPNASVYKGVIVNYSRNPERRFEFELGIDAESDPQDAIALGVATLCGLDFILDKPGPDAWIREVGDSNIVIWFSGWIDQTRTEFNRARSEAIRMVKLRLEAEGFSLPEPIYRLRLEGGDPFARPTPSTAPAATPPPRRDPAAVLPPDTPANTAADHTIKTMAEAERKESGQPDLLDTRAPLETG